MVLQSVSEFDIANCAIGLCDVARNAFVAFGSRSDRPVHGCVGANILAPLRTYFGEKIPPDECRPRSVRAMYDANRKRGKLQARIKASDRGIVPAADLTQEDV